MIEDEKIDLVYDKHKKLHATWISIHQGYKGKDTLLAAIIKKIKQLNERYAKLCVNLKRVLIAKHVHMFRK